MKKHEFYLEMTGKIYSNWDPMRFIIRHKGCFVAGDKDYIWGSFSSICSGCEVEIPKHLVIQRDLLNGGKVV